MAFNVAVDFDGVLNTYTGWCGDYELFSPREGVEDFLQSLSSEFNVIVFTRRKPFLVWDWLMKHGLAVYVDSVTNVKPKAFVYIDDRGYCFDGDFSKCLDVVRCFRAHWEEE